MKKTIALLLVLVVAASAAFALEFETSAGVGALYSYAYASSDDFAIDETYSGFGAKAFVDVTYLQVSVAYILEEETAGDVLDMSLLFKYPFGFSRFKLFPMAGVAYQMNLDYDEANAYSVRAGVGADIGIMESLYIRPTLILGYQLSSDVMDAVDDYTVIDVEIGAAVGFKF